MKIKVPHTLVLLFGMMVFALVLTYILPQGSFQMVENEQGREVVVANSYENMPEKSWLSPLNLFTVLPRAFADSQGIIFFVFIIGASTAFFSGLNLKRTGTITIYESAIATAQSTIPFSDIKNARMIVDKEPSLINPSRSVRNTKLLLIEARDGTTIVLSEEDYEVEKMMSQLKRAMGSINSR